MRLEGLDKLKIQLPHMESNPKHCVPIIIILVALYVCGTWSLVVWEEHKVIGFEKMELIRKFGSKRVEVRVSGYRSRCPRFDSRPYQIF
jgi:hypothetical protein